MIVHFNQPRFLPALNYFQRMLLVDTFVYRDDVQFQPKDWESRNKIKTPQGWMWLSVPMQKQPIGTPITEALIDNSKPWASKMLKSIACAYSKAPHFKEFFPQFEFLFGRRWDKLFWLNSCCIHLFRAAWDLDKCNFIFASRLGCTGDTDEILIAMCQKLSADVYLSGAEGRNYNRPERWAEAGIGLRYHDYVYPEYPQQHGPFLPWMSALDLLMNCGADGRKILEQFASV